MRILKLLFLSLVMLVPLVAFSADGAALIDPNLPPPEWLNAIVAFIQTVPYVGPGLVIALKVVAIVASVMSLLVVLARGVLAIPEIALRLAGKKDSADKVLAVADEIVHWLKWASVFNQQKRPAPVIPLGGPRDAA